MNDHFWGSGIGLGVWVTPVAGILILAFFLISYFIIKKLRRRKRIAKIDQIK